MERKVGRSVLRLQQGDITDVSTDAIVNAANSQLSHGGGVAAAIARAAGPKLVSESSQLAPVPVGGVAVTTAGNLKAKYVLHTVGPVWRGGDQNEAALLASAVRSSLEKADELHLQSIAFPAISTGIYGYPLREAAEVILSTILDYIREREIFVLIVLYSKHDLEVFAEVLDSL